MQKEQSPAPIFSLIQLKFIPLQPKEIINNEFQMKNSRRNIHALAGVAAMVLTALCGACGNTTTTQGEEPVMLTQGKYPYATFYKGQYFFTAQPAADTIYLTATERLEDIAEAKPQAVWTPDSAGKFFHIWSPELHRLRDAWYIYFEADDGNMDNHHLYVLENTSDDPLKGTWQMKGVLLTNDEWNFGLHPTVLNTGTDLYLLWSGWPKRRTEIETQCIYIARLENPWTVGSERVMLSHPEYEWELQWINPNGNRLAYPIYVNENPEAFLTPDGRHVCVCYSASGIWTIYHVLGMLTAPANADLLDPASWTKSPEPLFTGIMAEESSIAEKDAEPQNASTSSLAHQFTTLCGTSNICLVTDAATSRLITTDDGRHTPLLYEGMWFTPDDAEHRATFLGNVSWGDDGMPDFGQPAGFPN